MKSVADIVNELPHARCGTCGGNYAVRRNGVMREHRSLDNTAICPGAGRPPALDLSDTSEEETPPVVATAQSLEIAEFREIDVHELEPHPLQPRRDIGSVDELAGSIRELGVLEPLLVTPGSNGLFHIVAGKRRWTAAQRAGKATVPCIVRTIADVDALPQMLAENLHRKELTPLEEARGYAKLRELGLKQRDIMLRVSRSQGHVSKYLSVLRLPSDLQDKVDSGGIPMGAAVEVAKLVDAPERMADVVRRIDADTSVDQVANRVRTHLGELEQEQRRRAVADELEAQGIALVDWPRWGYFDHVEEKPIAGQDGQRERITDVHVELVGHRAEPCHGAAVDDDAKVVWVCLDPKRHALVADEDDPDADGERSPLQATASPPAEPDEDELQRQHEQAERDARQRELVDAQARRRAVMERVLRGRPAAGDVLGLVVPAFIGAMEDWRAASVAAELLGLEVQRADEYDDETATVALIATAQESPDAAARVALALCFATGEQLLVDRFNGWWEPEATAHLAFLIHAGYDVSPVEQAQLDAGTQHIAELAKGDVDDTGEPTGDARCHCGADPVWNVHCAEHLTDEERAEAGLADEDA